MKKLLLSFALLCFTPFAWAQACPPGNQSFNGQCLNNPAGVAVIAGQNATGTANKGGGITIQGGAPGAGSTAEGDVILFRDPNAPTVAFKCTQPTAGNVTTATCTFTNITVTGAGGGGGTPAGPSNAVQYNNGGVFGGDAGLSWDNTTDTLTVGTSAFSGGTIAPALASASSPGNGLSFAGTNGNGTSMAGGSLQFTGGAASGGTGAGGSINFIAGTNGPSYGSTAALYFQLDPTSFLVASQSQVAGGTTSTWEFSGSDAGTTSEMDFIMANGLTDGPIFCDPAVGFTGTSNACGIQNAVPSFTPIAGPALGCITNVDCYFVYGIGPKPIVRINGTSGSIPTGTWRFWGVPWSEVGPTSGEIVFKVQAAAGSYNMNWPTTAGTAGQWLTSQGGGSTAMTWSGGELTGTSASIGGGALAAGACASTATTVTGAAVGNRTVVTPNTYPGDSSFWKSYVSAVNTVTVLVCESIAATPTASTYNISVFQ